MKEVTKQQAIKALSTIHIGGSWLYKGACEAGIFAIKKQIPIDVIYSGDGYADGEIRN